MSAETGTRDKQIADALLNLRSAAEEGRTTVMLCKQDAHEQEATGHELMYAEAETHLLAAWRSIDRAYRIIQDGDPEDYA